MPAYSRRYDDSHSPRPKSSATIAHSSSSFPSNSSNEIFDQLVRLNISKIHHRDGLWVTVKNEILALESDQYYQEYDPKTLLGLLRSLSPGNVSLDGDDPNSIWNAIWDAAS